jgi:MFS family permease
MTASVIYLPLFAQAVMQASPTEAGAIVAPMLIGWPIASALSGRMLLAVGTRPLVRFGFSLVAISAVTLDVLVHTGAPPNALRACMFVFGTGMGLGSTPLIITVQDSVPFSRRGVATASVMFFRTIGGAVAVGVLGAVLAHALAGRVPESVLDALLGPDHGRSLGTGDVLRYRSEMQAGMAPIFHALAAMSVVGAFIGMAFPRVRVDGSAPDRAEVVASGE